jgi:hypothetical protein
MAADRSPAGYARDAVPLRDGYGRVLGRIGDGDELRSSVRDGLFRASLPDEPAADDGAAKSFVFRHGGVGSKRALTRS